jgi:hypothetical protein
MNTDKNEDLNLKLLKECNNPRASADSIKGLLTDGADVNTSVSKEHVPSDTYNPYPGGNPIFNRQQIPRDFQRHHLGRTPLILAAIHGADREILHLLVESGADINHRCNRGMSAWSVSRDSFAWQGPGPTWWNQLEEYGFVPNEDELIYGEAMSYNYIAARLAKIDLLYFGAVTLVPHKTNPRVLIKHPTRMMMDGIKFDMYNPIEGEKYCNELLPYFFAHIYQICSVLCGYKGWTFTNNINLERIDDSSDDRLLYYQKLSEHTWEFTLAPTAFEKLINNSLMKSSVMPMLKKFSELERNEIEAINQFQRDHRRKNPDHKKEDVVAGLTYISNMERLLFDEIYETHKHYWNDLISDYQEKTPIGENYNAFKGRIGYQHFSQIVSAISDSLTNEHTEEKNSLGRIDPYNHE